MMAVWSETQIGRVIHAGIVVWALQVATVIGCVIPQPVSSLLSASLPSVTGAAVIASSAWGVSPDTATSTPPANSATVSPSSPAAPSAFWTSAPLPSALSASLTVTEAAVSASSAWDVSPDTATSTPPADSVTVSPSAPAAPSGFWASAPLPSALPTSPTPAWEIPVTSTAVAIGRTGSGSSIISPTATLFPVGHFVEVGENHQPSSGDGLFFPAQIDAQRGDLIEFRLSAPYELYLSSLSRPCDSMLPVLNDRATENASSVFNFAVLDSDPIWFYTSRAGESPSCGNRSVFAVNPGENLNTFLTNANVDSSMPEQV